jgi:acyl-[acyl-carrier-protein] desaturase
MFVKKTISLIERVKAMDAQNEVQVTSHQLEVVKSIEGFVGTHLDSLLLNVDESWQPSDYLPDLSAENWKEQLTDFRRNAIALSDEVLVVLVGDMVTEEALPTYQTWLNRLQGVTDPTGASPSPWARWSRGWTAEENRHGDLLNKYLYLTGRVDMRSVETTIHHLINNGFDPQTENDPYLGFVYTSFQERATKISHRNVGVLAKRAGEDHLHKICGMIAGDEARHEKAYKLFMAKIFELDPAKAVQAFAKMMKSKIAMPAMLMDDGRDKNLFSKFSVVAQKIGVYTAKDYAEIIGALVHEWKIESITGISGASSKAQEYLCGLSERYLKLAERMKFSGVEKFSWLYDKEIALSSVM